MSTNVKKENQPSRSSPRDIVAALELFATCVRDEVTVQQKFNIRLLKTKINKHIDEQY